MTVKLYLHGIERQVAGDLELLHEHLLLDVVDADKLRLASCQNRLPVRRVAQRSERSYSRKKQPEQIRHNDRNKWNCWRCVQAHSLALGQLLGCDFIGLFAARLQVVTSRHRARLRGCLGVPESDLPVQGGHG